MSSAETLYMLRVTNDLLFPTLHVTGIPIFWPYPKFTVDTYLVDIGDQP